MSRLRTHYDNLKVSRDAPDFVIRAAYKTLCQKYHPDKNPDNAQSGRIMGVINRSYEVLSDPAQRADHDAWIAQEEMKRARGNEQSEGGVSIPPHWQSAGASTTAQASEPGSPRHHRPASPGIFKGIATGLLSIVLQYPKIVIYVLIGGGLWISLHYSDMNRPPPVGPKTYQTQAPTSVRLTPAPTRVVDRNVRPTTAPNGRPWPDGAAYVSGYPIDHDDGYSKVTVDNSRNTSDVFVKLVLLDGPTAYPVRQFFIPASSRFTLNEVTAGQYDIRYRDLGSGGLSRSEAFDVKEAHTSSGIQYSEITMTLYKVQGGNFETYRLDDAEF